MKHFLTPVICLVLLSMPVNAQTFAQRLKGAVDAGKALGAALIFPTTRKKVRFEETPALSYESPKLTEETPALLQKDFPWEEYERLETAYERGDYLSQQEFMRLLELQAKIKYQELEAPEQSKQPVFISNPTGKTDTVPGIKTAGCGASTDKSVATSAKPKEEKISLDANGLLDLSRVQNPERQLARLSAEEKALVATIDISYCELSGVLPDLSGFTNLKKLVASNNQLTGFGNLPVSLEEIHINNNLFSHEPINALLALTHLRILDARFNQLNQFPTNIYRTLEANRQTGAKLELIGNRFTELPDFVLNSAV